MADKPSDAAPAARPAGAPALVPTSRAALSSELADCARAIARTLDGDHLDHALEQLTGAATTTLPPASRAPVRDMAYATMRAYGRVGWMADQLNARKPAPLLGALQICAMTAVLDARRPAPIVIDQAVAAARELLPGAAGKSGSGFINATLRRFLRERVSLDASAQVDLQARTGLPRWWVELLMKHYPGSWEAIVTASMTKAPLTLRLNTRRTDVGTITRRFDEAGIGWRRTGLEALTLDKATAVERIPGFAEGLVTVQDAGAQLAAPLLGARNGERVLDACAAPGGKTTHLLELADCDVVALELDPHRANRIRENLRRQQLSATVVEGDATSPQQWWDGQSFDRIMLDAPCSASGIVRRHPDVPWHRRRSDIETFAAAQRRLLDALWPLLKAGGTLVYVTCSIFPEEGESVITAFCSHHADADRHEVVVRWADGDARASQLIPKSDDGREHDGYFYALLSKRT